MSPPTKDEFFGKMEKTSMHLPDLCINTTAILHFLSSTLHSILELTAITVQTAPADQANFVSVALDPLWEKEPPFQTLLG